MQKQKVTVPKREKMLRAISRAAKMKTLVGGTLFTANIGSYVRQNNIEDGNSLSPKSGCKSAGRCAMGELFYAAGYSNNKLDNMDGNETGWDQKDFQTLWDHYRIDAKDAQSIINANDDTEGCSLEDFVKRENKVTKVITGLKDRVRVDPYRYELDGGSKSAVILTKEERALLKELEELDQYRDVSQVGF